MIELLVKFLGQLLSPAVERVQARVQKFSTYAQVAIAVGVVCVGILFYYRDSLPDLTMDAGRYVRVLLGGSQIPLSPEAKAEAHDVATHLSDELEAEVINPRRIDPPSAWTLAQLVASKAETHSFDHGVVTAYFAESTSPLCSCWGEVPEDVAPNIVVSGWVLYALAAIREPAANDYIQYVLEQQNTDGSWSVFRNPIDEDNKDYHSTYATAWVIIGLEAQVAANCISASIMPRVSASLKIASAWLVSQQSPKSRWKNYPLAPFGVVSLSLSGLALHALHISDPNAALLEGRWLDDLPPSVSKPDEAEAKLEWFRTRDGRKQDHFSQLVLPWLSCLPSFRTDNI